jgi:primosomal protein N' (replication factor Y) (superfamily II helicase)
VTGTPVPISPAAEQPVARVAVDVPLPHLDRLFDYLVPSALADAALPGCRVRVRFSGRLTSGYLVERAATSDHEGTLAFLRRVVSPEPVLSAEIAWLARAVADRYGGTMADVLRLAIPPRHAAAEKGGAWPAGSVSGGVQDIGGWARYRAGQAFLAAVAAGRAPHAVWSALPGQDWPAEIARAATAAASADRGVVIVVPDARDLALVDAALTLALGPGAHVSMAASLGPAERYRRWLAVRRGQVRVAAGTRSAMFAPVADLGLVVIWDDGDDLHNEPRAPYPHARDVLLLRAHHSGAAALVGGFARTAEATQLLETGWAKQLAADRATVRRHAPLVRAASDDAETPGDAAGRKARLPAPAVRTAQVALSTGPVLFQVPRRGYLAAVACQRCRAPRRCDACGGPVTLPGRDLPPQCAWCATPAAVACPNCGATEVRALVTGSRRTAEELSRAFPGVPVRVSSGASVLADVPPDPAVVVATPGAEPVTKGGYAAAILLDGWALLGRASSRAGEEALRRWMNAAALVRPGPDGGNVVVLAEPGVPAVQALIRWDAAGYSERDLAERTELGFPPAVRMAELTGPPPALRDLIADAALPDGAEVVGPVASSNGDVRYLVRAPTEAGGELAVSLRAALARRTARKEPGAIRLRLDPAELI